MRARVELSWQRACLASTKPWVLSQEAQKLGLVLNVCPLSIQEEQEDQKFKSMPSLRPAWAMGDCLEENNGCDMVEVSSTGLSHLISLL